MNLSPNQLRTAAWLAIAVAVWLLLSWLAPVLMPFVLAGVLAYALHPAVEQLHARRVPRWLGAGLALLLLGLVLLAVVLLIVPVITKQLPLLKEQVPLLLDKLNAWLATLKNEHTFVAAGSSLKFCRIAEGQADIYPRFGPTSQWDTAAAQAVLEVAGGAVTDLQGTPLCYGLDRPVLNPEFVAVGSPALLQLPE